MAGLTKQAIINSFVQLAAEKTVDKITVKDITDRCGVSRNTFYYHFKDVYDVLEQFLEDQTREAITLMEKMDLDPCWHPDRRPFEQVLSNKDLFYHLYQSAGKQEVRRYLERSGETIFDHGIERLAKGKSISAEDKRLIASFFGSAFRGVLIDWMEDRLEGSIEDIFQRLDYLLGDCVMEAIQRGSIETKKKK